MTTPAVLAALDAFVRAIVRDELGDRAPDVYGSRAPYAPPPGRSPSWCKKTLPKIPGAKKEGGKRGRGVRWTISREAYEAWIESRRRAKPSTTPETTDVIDDATTEKWISEAGFRLTAIRGGRGR